MKPIRAILVIILAMSLMPSPGAGTVGGDGVVERLYASYATILERHVDAEGFVDYAALKADRGELDRFAAELAAFDPAVYDVWTNEGKIALWLNAYNALTLIAIIDHYPIQPSKARALVFPESSIRHIPGVWDSLRFSVMGEELTLDAIEHEVLRVRFDEPRIHMALVCAAVGCPPLRSEPYVAERLPEQLDDQVRRFVALDRHFDISRERAVVHLSSIFDWFADDFTGSGDPRLAFEQKLIARHLNVLQFIVPYLSADDRAFVLRKRYDVAYIQYDWALNEQGAH